MAGRSERVRGRPIQHPFRPAIDAALAMRAETFERAVRMLSEVLEEGMSFRAVALRNDISTSTVERQIKRLLWHAAKEAGFPKVPDEALTSITLMRYHGSEILAAVRGAGPPMRSYAPTHLDDEELSKGIRRIRRLSETANRDVALLLVLLSTGAKPAEIARLTVRDYLRSDGTACQESVLPARASCSGRSRPIFFSSDRVCGALDDYLEERLRRGLGVSQRKTFRGLAPDSALFLTEFAQPFQVRGRSPSDPRPVCPVLGAVFRGVFGRAGWVGVTTQNLRRQFAQKVAGNGADSDQLGQLLGLTSRRQVSRLLQRDAHPLVDVVRDLV